MLNEILVLLDRHYVLELKPFVKLGFISANYISCFGALLVFDWIAKFKYNL